MNYISAMVITYTLIATASACGKKAEPTEAPPVVEEMIEANAVPENEAARSDGSSVASAADIRRLTEQLFELVPNTVYSQITLDRQGKTTDVSTADAAPRPLFTSINPEAFRPVTISLMKALLDNYVEDVGIDEVITRQEISEKDAFLNAVSTTPVMKKVEEYLRSKGFIYENIRTVLDRLWFTTYSRLRNRLGSSGFEHVFLGEVKRSEVSGFHNWIYFYDEEKVRDLDYQGYMKSLQFGNKGEVITMRFNWMNQRKPYGSMFIGTLPELEMAVYTVCFYLRPNKNCGISFLNNRFSVKVYGQNHRGQNVIGSAFPQLY